MDRILDSLRGFTLHMLGAWIVAYALIIAIEIALRLGQPS